MNSRRSFIGKLVGMILAPFAVIKVFGKSGGSVNDMVEIDEILDNPRVGPGVFEFLEEGRIVPFSPRPFTKEEVLNAYHASHWWNGFGIEYRPRLERPTIEGLQQFIKSSKINKPQGGTITAFVGRDLWNALFEDCTARGPNTPGVHLRICPALGLRGRDMILCLTGYSSEITEDPRYTARRYTQGWIAAIVAEGKDLTDEFESQDELDKFIESFR